MGPASNVIGDVMGMITGAGQAAGAGAAATAGAIGGGGFISAWMPQIPGADENTAPPSG